MSAAGTTLIFDCDGVLADTERWGHRVAFNRMFEEFGLPVRWDEEEYGRRLAIGGGKERLASLLTPEFAEAAELPTGEDARRDLLATWHRRKTEIYTELVDSGALPARPGVHRISAAADRAGWTLAVASTSAEPSVRAVLRHAVGDELAARFTVFAGDIVPAKKPAPDIYLAAVAQLGADPGNTVVVEDSRNGLLAAHGANLPTLITTNAYTSGEDFSEAAIVVDSLGDPGEVAVTVAQNRTAAAIGAHITLDDLLACTRVGTTSGIPGSECS